MEASLVLVKRCNSSFSFKRVRNLQDTISWKTDAIGPARKSRQQRKIQAELISTRTRLFRESFGQFNEDAAVARILDFSKGNDEPQPFNDI